MSDVNTGNLFNSFVHQIIRMEFQIKILLGGKGLSGRRAKAETVFSKLRSDKTMRLNS